MKSTKCECGFIASYLILYATVMWAFFQLCSTILILLCLFFFTPFEILSWVFWWFVFFSVPANFHVAVVFDRANTSTSIPNTACMLERQIPLRVVSIANKTETSKIYAVWHGKNHQLTQWVDHLIHFDFCNDFVKIVICCTWNGPNAWVSRALKELSTFCITE